MKKKENISMQNKIINQPIAQEKAVQNGGKQNPAEKGTGDVRQDDSSVDENPEDEDDIIDENPEDEDDIIDEESEDTDSILDRDSENSILAGNLENTDTSGDEQETEELPRVLTAVYPILYLSHQYKVGDILPANDVGMVEAWLCAGTAVWINPAGEMPKAKKKTAEPGLSGQAATSEAEDGDDLVGKIPKTYGRKRRV